MVIEPLLNPTQWVGLIAFLATAVAAGFLARRKKDRPNGNARVWRLVALAHLAFAAEVVVGARHGVHNMVNTVLRDYGIYPDRASIQVALLVLCGLCSVFGIGAARRWLGDHPQPKPHVRRAVFATLAVGALFMVESVSLHAIDQLLYASTGPVRAIAVLWVCAALAILTSVWAEIYKK